MYLSSMKLTNFRQFADPGQEVKFNSNMNVLVGENDSGKSAILDAIRIVLGTTDLSWHRIDISDFNNEDNEKIITINLKFDKLTGDEQGAFAECLTTENEQPLLYLHWTCKFLKNFTPYRISTSVTTGKNGQGPTPSQDARELLRVTYLRALRDSYSDMQSGRNSRLSQIVGNIDGLNTGVHEYVAGVDLSTLSISGIADLSNKLLREHEKLKVANEQVTQILEKKLMLKNDTLKTRFEVSGSKISEDKKLLALLEKLDLVVDKEQSETMGKVGLGTSNILSMACELLLNTSSTNSSFLLIEEPEAHIHAQRQLRLIQALQTEAQQSGKQIILTTHSPLLASAVELNNLIIIKNAKPYSLAKEHTKLDESDYVFLERYLDATRANLFFAKGVIIVEGPSEALLLPTIAKLLGKSLTEYGISIVDVKSTGLRRYAKIFQRQNEEEVFDVKVACITDKDIMPDTAPGICIENTYMDKSTWPGLLSRKWRAVSDYSDDELAEHVKKIKEKADGQTVKSFVSDHWTFEYDLAYSGLLYDMVDVLINMMYVESKRETNKTKLKTLIDEQDSIEGKAAIIYKFFYKNNVSKAEFAQQFAQHLENTYKGRSGDLSALLPAYIKDAINYVTD